jgi:hypothetical protein
MGKNLIKKSTHFFQNAKNYSLYLEAMFSVIQQNKIC